MTDLRVQGAGRRGSGDLTEQPAQADGRRPPKPGSRLGPAGWLRWGWRQLTSMRTALILLFLLAVASIPGSVLPQEGIDPAAVTQYYASHPELAPILNRLSLFSVFAAPWFAAIYLLLFLSLAGCVLPRTFRLVGSSRQQPPRAPGNLARLPMVARYETASEPDAALAAAGRMLAARRFRLRTGNGWVSAEKGYLREVGNLLFHIALLALLGSVALGGIWGYKANRLLVAGQSFANTPTALDVFRPGRLVTPSNLQPFTITLKSFRASYVTSGPERSQPITFDASLQYAAAAGAPERSYLLRVNHPLRVDGVRVYLIGHGYAPIFKITSATGKVEFNDPVPFIPVEQSGLTSEGVIKVPFASPSQLGFAGVFLPSAADLGGRLESVFPAPLNPEVSLVSYAGNLGMGSGPPQSVYQLVTSQMHKLPIAPRPLAVGQSMKLPDGAGTLTFTGYRQWISLAITYDPGQTAALISGILALAGLILSFMVRRRRIFVRAYRGPDGGTIVDVGGLARSDAAGGFEGEFAHLAEQFRAGDGGRPLAADPGQADIAPADIAPADIAPADIAPADIAPADTAPADTAPADTAPADTAPQSPVDSQVPADAAPAAHRTTQPISGHPDSSLGSPEGE